LTVIDFYIKKLVQQDQKIAKLGSIIEIHLIFYKN